MKFQETVLEYELDPVIVGGGRCAALLRMQAFCHVVSNVLLAAGYQKTAAHFFKKL